MSANYKLTAGLAETADRLKRAREAVQGPNLVSQAIIKTTLQAHEMIADKITNDIEPHSAMSRRPPVPVATDLVDTGAYRQSWTTEFPDLMTGRLITNSAYAIFLELGTVHMPAFYVARDTADKMSGIFKDNIERAIEESLR